MTLSEEKYEEDARERDVSHRKQFRSLHTEFKVKFEREKAWLTK